MTITGYIAPEKYHSIFKNDADQPWMAFYVDYGSDVASLGTVLRTMHKEGAASEDYGAIVLATANDDIVFTSQLRSFNEGRSGWVFCLDKPVPLRKTGSEHNADTTFFTPVDDEKTLRHIEEEKDFILKSARQAVLRQLVTEGLLPDTIAKQAGYMPPIPVKMNESLKAPPQSYLE